MEAVAQRFASISEKGKQKLSINIEVVGELNMSSPYDLIQGEMEKISESSIFNANVGES